MPNVEFQCAACDHVFERALLRGEPSGEFVCPKCGRSQSVRPLPGAESPFDGRSGVARDTN
jgi:putative FmdB family regulatory protein